MLKSIVSIFGGLILIFFIFMVSLYNGIKIDQYSNDSIDIKSLYIKYDKKLSLMFSEYKSSIKMFELHIENSKKQEVNH